MKYIHIIIILFLNNITINNAKSSTNFYWSVSITNSQYSAPSMPILITSTNLIVKYPSEETRFIIKYDRWDEKINSNLYFPELNDEIVITTNRTTRFYHGAANISYEFIPVSFTNQLISFKVEHSYATKWDFSISSGPVAFTNHTYYVALSDTLVEVGEEDVERELLAEDDD